MVTSLKGCPPSMVFIVAQYLLLCGHLESTGCVKPQLHVDNLKGVSSTF